MDPTIHSSQRTPQTQSLKRKWYFFGKKVSTWFWLIIIIFLLVEAILTVNKVFFAKRPNERMCWDDSMCFTYCYTGHQGICLQPPAHDTDGISDAIKLLTAGKRNIIEIINKKQAYCACEVSEDNQKRTDVFYKFYWDNK